MCNRETTGNPTAETAEKQSFCRVALGIGKKVIENTVETAKRNKKKSVAFAIGLPATTLGLVKTGKLRQAADFISNFDPSSPEHLTIAGAGLAAATIGALASTLHADKKFTTEEITSDTETPQVSTIDPETSPDKDKDEKESEKPTLLDRNRDKKYDKLIEKISGVKYYKDNFDEKQIKKIAHDMMGLVEKFTGDKAKNYKIAHRSAEQIFKDFLNPDKDGYVYVDNGVNILKMRFAQPPKDEDGKIDNGQINELLGVEDQVLKGKELEKLKTGFYRPEDVFDYLRHGAAVSTKPEFDDSSNLIGSSSIYSEKIKSVVTANRGYEDTSDSNHLDFYARSGIINADENSITSDDPEGTIETIESKSTTKATKEKDWDRIRKRRLVFTVALGLTALIVFGSALFANIRQQNDDSQSTDITTEDEFADNDDYESALDDLVVTVDIPNEVQNDYESEEDPIIEVAEGYESEDEEFQPIHPFNEIFDGIPIKNTNDIESGQPIGATMHFSDGTVVNIIQGHHHENGDTNIEANNNLLNTINQQNEVVSTGTREGWFKFSGHNRFGNTLPAFRNLEEWSRDAHGELVHINTDEGIYTYTIVERIVTTEIGGRPFMSDEMGNNVGEPVSDENIFNLIDRVNRICDPNCDGSRCILDPDISDTDPDLNCLPALYIVSQVCRDVAGERRIVILVKQLTSFTPVGGDENDTIHVDFEWTPQPFNQNNGFRIL